MDDSHPYGLKPGVFCTLSEEEQHPLVRKICNSIAEGERIETACWLAEVHPDEFSTVCQDNKHLWGHVMNARARAERKLRKVLSAGGKGMSEAKAALEMLDRTFAGWEKKTSINIAKQFEEQLVAILARLEPNKTFTGAQAADIVLAELKRAD